MDKPEVSKICKHVTMRLIRADHFAFVRGRKRESLIVWVGTSMSTSIWRVAQNRIESAFHLANLLSLLCPDNLG